MPQSAHNCIFTGERDLRGRRVGVLGMARSGAACVNFLAGRGAQVVALDSKPPADLSDVAQDAATRAAQVAAPYGSLAAIAPLDLLVVSPGVPTDADIVIEARSSGAEVIGEVELAYRFMDAPIAAVTGTCGKGTTVTVLGALLAAAGMPNVVAGNIGTPLIAQADASGGLDVVVAEISSFQLDTTVHFRPHIGVLLNITEDHLERYPSFDAYAASKAQLFRNQSAEDWAILCIDDARVRAMADQVPSRVLTVSASDPATHGRVEDDTLVVKLPGAAAEVIARTSDLTLQGTHHVTNCLAAALAARLCDVPPAVMPGAFRGYEPAPHLMTLVAESNGVLYIDDSKATNPASAVADLSAIDGPVVVIAGGKEKDTDFAEFGEVLARQAKLVLLMGECAPRIERATNRPEICRHVRSMAEAVRIAVESAEPGDTVALCPACSSLDMFRSYAARGDEFADAVRQYTTHC